MKNFCILIAGILLSGNMFAQSYTVSGKVLDANNRSVQQAVVTIYQTAMSSSTDAAGNFMFRNVPAGSYELKVAREGYQGAGLLIKVDRENVVVRVILHTQSHQLQEVKVTDNHLQTRKQEESLNVETVNQDFIQRNLGGSLMKTLERLPGIKTIGIGSGQSKPLIRGLGFNRVVVVDKGVKHEGQQWGADHGLEIDQFAASEVELIKGAASFMYGSDAIGGVIDVKPAPVPMANSIGGSLDIVAKTNNNLYGTSANLFGRNEHWFFDSRFTYQSYGDYRVPTDRVYVYDFAVALHQNYLRNTAGREKGLHFNAGYVNDHFRSVFYISNVFSNSGFFANAHGLEPRQVNTAMHDASSRDILMPSQEVNHFKVINRSTFHTGIHKLEMELGYQRNFRQEFSQYVNHGYMPPLYPDTMRIPPNLERQYDKHVYSVNLRDQITLGRHMLMIGLNSEHQDNAIDGWTFLVPGFKQTTAGLFAYDKYVLSEQLLLHGALRFDYGQVKTLKYVDWFPSQVIDETGTYSRNLTRAGDLNRSYRSMVWSIGLNYNPGQFALKANVGKSFRMPIVKETGANGVNYHYFSYELGDPSLSPEQSYQADLSLGWNEERWSVQISPFYNYFPNYIYLNPTPRHSPGAGGGNQIFQYAQSEVLRYGGEVQLKYRVTKSLSTELLAEYLYAEQRSGDKKGFTLPFSPPASALLNLTWSPYIGRGLSSTYFSVDYRLTARQDNIVPPEKKTPGYQLFNIQAGTKISLYNQPVSIGLQVQNLMNTRYLNHTSFYRLIELPEFGRNIVFSMKVPFHCISKQK